MRLIEVLDLFIVQLRADGRSGHTIAQYERSIRWLVRELGDRDVDAVTHEDLARFLVSPTARQTRFGLAKSPATTNALRTSVRCFFRYAHDAGFACANAARLVRRARCSSAPPRSLSDDELARLEAIMVGARSESARRDRVLVHLLLATGIRLGSALALDIEDVDLPAGQLSLRTMKNAGSGRVYLHPRIAEEVRGLIVRRTSGPVFLSRSGARLCRRHAQRAIVTWLRAAGARRASTHNLRHTFGQRLLDRTGDLALVQAAMHHRSPMSTMAYTVVRDAAVRLAIRGPEDARSPAATELSVRQAFSNRVRSSPSWIATDRSTMCCRDSEDRRQPGGRLDPSPGGHGGVRHEQPADTSTALERSPS